MSSSVTVNPQTTVAPSLQAFAVQQNKIAAAAAAAITPSLQAFAVQQNKIAAAAAAAITPSLQAFAEQQNKIAATAAAAITPSLQAFAVQQNKIAAAAAAAITPSLQAFAEQYNKILATAIAPSLQGIAMRLESLDLLGSMAGGSFQSWARPTAPGAWIGPADRLSKPLREPSDEQLASSLSWLSGLTDSLPAALVVVNFCLYSYVLITAAGLVGPDLQAWTGLVLSIIGAEMLRELRS